MYIRVYAFNAFSADYDIYMFTYVFLQTSDKLSRYNKSRSSMFILDNRDPSILKTIKLDCGWRWSGGREGEI